MHKSNCNGEQATSILELDLMNFFLKHVLGSNPIIQGKAILVANTLTASHKDE